MSTVDTTSLSTDLIAHVLECVHPVQARWRAFIAMMRTSRHMRDASIMWLRSVRECKSSSLPAPLPSIAAIIRTGSLRGMTFDDEHDNAILTLASHCPALASIELDVDFPLTDRALLALGHGSDDEHVKQRERTSELTHVVLDGGRYACSVTDAGIAALARGNPRLTKLELKLSWTSSVTDASISTLVTNCTSLTHLTLKSSDVTDVGVQKLSQLRHLNLESARLVSASTLHSCIQLESVVLRECYHVSDDGIKLMANHCRRLRHVDLAYCTYVSDDGVGALSAHCDHLEYVDVTACYGVSNVGRTLVESKGARCVCSSYLRADAVATSSMLSLLF